MYSVDVHTKTIGCNSNVCSFVCYCLQRGSCASPYYLTSLGAAVVVYEKFGVVSLCGSGLFVLLRCCRLEWG